MNINPRNYPIICRALAASRVARPVQHEQNDCIALNEYLEILQKVYPFTYTHIPNGGHRHKKVATDLKKMGVKSGVWDYMFRATNRATHWIEMKYGKNDLTAEQIMWREALQPMGDTFDVCYGPLEALISLKRKCIIPSDSFRVVGNAVIINLRTGRKRA